MKGESARNEKKIYTAATAALSSTPPSKNSSLSARATTRDVSSPNRLGTTSRATAGSRGARSRASAAPPAFLPPAKKSNTTFRRLGVDGGLVGGGQGGGQRDPAHAAPDEGGQGRVVQAEAGDKGSQLKP